MTGVGTRDRRSGIENPIYLGGNPVDLAASLTGKQRIDRLILDLRLYSDGIDDDTAVDIDVIGYSRGAAQARDFANQIAAATRNGFYSYTDSAGRQQCQRVNFRFMGLFDTVLSVATGSYDLSIAAGFRYVSQAVALNEYRALYPLESIMGGAVATGQTLVERGFIGAHSDIGGGLPSAEGDLYKVALVWMIEQARAAGVNMGEPDRSVSSAPLVHDQSSLFGERPLPSGGEDRAVRYRDGRSERLRTATIGGMSFTDTQRFIDYGAVPRAQVAGPVDMQAYLEWLNDPRNGYGNLALTVN